VPNLVEIAQTAAEMWGFFDFSKMAAVSHFGFVMYLRVWIENAYSRPKIGDLGVLTPKWGAM